MKLNKVLWYNKPATRWYEALPLGNGRLGAMVYGGVIKEEIALAEATCYSGKVEEGNKPEAYKSLPAIREALINQEYKRARELCENMTGIMDNYGTNLPMGSLSINFNFNNANIEKYKRYLDLQTATTVTEFTKDNVDYYREVFVSNPDQVIVIQLSANQPNTLSFVLKFKGGQNPHQILTENKDLVLYGQAYEDIHTKEQCGVDYCERARVNVNDGEVVVKDNSIVVSGASQATIYIAMNTTFNPANPKELCAIESIKQSTIQAIDCAERKGYEQLTANHIQDYQNLFSRVEFDLISNELSHLPTDKRVKRVRNGETDDELTVLLFHYARYLLISSSRENSPLPTHLQGVWNDNVACRIGWTCDMHIDINTQMNYWLAEKTNLAECTKPLHQWIEKTLVPSGRETAKKSYDCNGWVAHTVSNPWGFTAPGRATYWGFHVTGGAWIASHLWDYYQFTNDVDFLKEHAYPVLKEAAEFFLDYLFIDPKLGYLVTGPSHSPENIFMHEGEAYSIDIMPTCDIVLLRALFGACMKGASIIKIDEDFVNKLENIMQQLPPYQIGQHGQLQEWIRDYEEGDINHRHTSHLMGLYPFADIKPDTTPNLCEAIKISIERRMTPEKKWEDTGWARSLLLGYAARLWDGEMSYKHINDMQRHLLESNLMVIHPPCAGADSNVYELDGNTGLCSGVTEILLQSDGEIIYLLPALPKSWANGYVKGLKARGGFEVEMEWQNGELIRAVILSEKGNRCKVRKPDGEVIELIGVTGAKIVIDNM